MSTVSQSPQFDPETAYQWALAAGRAATDVPAAGAERIAWITRGWAETALGCAVVGHPEAFAGLDDAVRAAALPCTGPFADRLRVLRSLGGDLPRWYGAPDPDPPAPAPVPEHVAAACEALAEFCDALAGAAALRGGTEQEPPPWSGTADHLRWGERFRAGPGGAATAGRRYRIHPTSVDASLVRRSWMLLPTLDAPRPVLINPALPDPASTRQRIRQGIHNGAHLDHLDAVAAWTGPAWQPCPAEFGRGLLAAEAYAMSAELLAAVECLLDGRPAEVRRLRAGLVSRIGRLPGYRDWHAARRPESAALQEAAYDKVDEFAALPVLAAAYVAGPLRLMAADWADPTLPAGLARRIAGRWAQAAARFDPAAALTLRAKALN
jgi:hypothetical protein